MKFRSRKEEQKDLPEKKLIEIAVVDDVEGQALQNVFRGMIIATKDLDYRDGCVTGRTGECAKRELLQVLREQFAEKHPDLYRAGIEGPETRQFRSLSAFCQSCIMAGGRKGKHFPGNAEKEEKAEETEKVEDEKQEPVKKRHFWNRRKDTDVEVQREAFLKESEDTENVLPPPETVSAEIITSQAQPAATVEAPNEIPKKKEDVVSRADFGPKISETARALRTGTRSSRTKIYSEIARIEKKAPETQAGAVMISDEGGV